MPLKNWREVSGRSHKVRTGGRGALYKRDELQLEDRMGFSFYTSRVHGARQHRRTVSLQHRVESGGSL